MLHNKLLAFTRRSFGSNPTHRPDFHSTTVLNVRKGNKVVMIADGQISLGPTVFKNTAKKLRRIQDNVICGFAGSAADCLALMELLEKEFEKYPGQTLRSCLSLAKQWRTNKMHA
jgi:ATP-dependent HslUV protease subunit HslV